MRQMVVSLWLQLGLTVICVITSIAWFDRGVAVQQQDYLANQSVPMDSLSEDNQSTDIQEIARLTTVRILTRRSSGSGVIVARCWFCRFSHHYDCRWAVVYAHIQNSQRARFL